MSDEIVAAIGYDLSRFPMPRSKTFDIAVRAKKLDEVVRSFIARHPRAVVLDLGVGLDPRITRVEPPATVDWYDIDLPEVIETRRAVLPAWENAHTIAADLTEQHWLERVPADRPTVIVADGLLAFLSEHDFADLLNRLTQHFPSGELAFNGYTRFHVWAIKHYRGTDSIADVVRHPGFDNPYQPQRWAPRLALVEEIFLTRVPEVAQLPRALRVLTRLAGRSAAVSRRGTTVLRYRF